MERHLVGLYAGQAADGVDAALAAVRGRGERMKLRQLRVESVAFEPSLRQRIVGLCDGRAESTVLLCEVEQLVTAALVEAGEKVIQGLATEQTPVVVGCRGAMIHGPHGRSGAGVVSLCDAAGLTKSLSLPVAAGFEAGDVAAGGVGTAGEAWADWLLFRDKRLSRVVVRLGGTTRLTFVPGGAHPSEVVCYDVGPGTCVLDGMSARLTGRPMDIDGTTAAAGQANRAMLNELLADWYFELGEPKATCRAHWGESYLWRLGQIAQKHGCQGVDVLATAAELVAQLVAREVAGLTERPHEVILAGGGARNIHLAGRIRALLSPSSTYTVERYGIGLHGLGAMCAAALGAARLDGAAVNCSRASGGAGARVLGGLWLA